MKVLRKRARELALQAIYQWQFNHNSLTELQQQFCVINPLAAKKDDEYLHKILAGVIMELANIDAVLQPALDRNLDKLNAVEMAVLRLAIYELIYCLEVPYKVVINEALELTKKFGSIDGYKYVNGVLDKIAKDVRQQEQ